VGTTFVVLALRVARYLLAPVYGWFAEGSTLPI
jgi:hypothetical protein